MDPDLRLNQLKEDPYFFDLLRDQHLYVITLNENDRLQVRSYTGDRYEEINAKIKAKEIDAEIKAIDRIFEDVPSLREPLVVYRKISGVFDPNIRTYVSTSLSPYQSLPIKNGETYLRILLPIGSKVLPLALISTHADENEILLPRFGLLLLTAISEVQMRRNAQAKAIRVNITINDLVYISEAAVQIKDIPVKYSKRQILEAIRILEDNLLISAEDDPKEIEQIFV